jgi:hypothetical protein
MSELAGNARSNYAGNRGRTIAPGSFAASLKSIAAMTPDDLES